MVELIFRCVSGLFMKMMCTHACQLDCVTIEDGDKWHVYYM